MRSGRRWLVTTAGVGIVALAGGAGFVAGRYVHEPTVAGSVGTADPGTGIHDPRTPVIDQGTDDTTLVVDQLPIPADADPDDEDVAGYARDYLALTYTIRDAGTDADRYRHVLDRYVLVGTDHSAVWARTIQEYASGTVREDAEGTVFLRISVPTRITLDTYVVDVCRDTRLLRRDGTLPTGDAVESTRLVFAASDPARVPGPAVPEWAVVSAIGIPDDQPDPCADWDTSADVP